MSINLYKQKLILYLLILQFFSSIITLLFYITQSITRIQVTNSTRPPSVISSIIPHLVHKIRYNQHQTTLNNALFTLSPNQDTKYSTALFGKNSLNSPQSCAAKVLLCAMISVGLFNFSMTFAMVNVLPDPVTPSRVWHWLPSLKPFTRASIACG